MNSEEQGMRSKKKYLNLLMPKLSDFKPKYYPACDSEHLKSVRNLSYKMARFLALLGMTIKKRSI